MEVAMRRGTGLIVLLAVVAASILFILFLNQAWVTSWASAEIDASLRGDAAEMLADSANAEAMAWLRPRLADPTSDEGALLRSIDPDQWTLSFPDVPTPHTVALLDEDDFSGFLVEGPTIEVLRQASLNGTTYERRGIIRVHTAVTSPRRLGRPITRRVETAFPVVVTLPGVPRPADSYGIFVADSRGVTDRQRVNALRTDLLAELNRMWDFVASARSMGVDYDWDELDDLLVEADSADRALPLPLEADAVFYGLEHDGLSIDTAVLDLAADLSPLLDQAREAGNRLQTAFESLQTVPGDEDRLHAFVEALQQVDQPVRQALWNLWAYRRAFRFLPSSHEAYGSLVSINPRFSPEHWLRRARFVLRPDMNGASVDEEWQRFLSLHRSPQGVVVVENHANPLRLSGIVPGNLTIVTGDGGVIMEDLSGDTDEGPPLTVVARGGPVRIDGRVEAAVVLVNGTIDGPSSLSLTTDATLVGSLVAWRLPQRAEFGGLVIRAERHSSGVTTPSGRVYVDPTHLVVGVAHAPAYRRVVRR